MPAYVIGYDQRRSTRHSSNRLHYFPPHKKYQLQPEQSRINDNPSLGWPALFHVDGDDELLVFQSAAQFQDAIRQPDHDIQVRVQYYPAQHDSATNNGVLIDTRGDVFNWEISIDDASYRATDRHLELAAVVDLVKRHAAVQGHCCVAKLGAGSISQAIALVEHLNQ